MPKLRVKFYRDGGEVVRGKISATILVGVLVFENNKTQLPKETLTTKDGE
ncbi:MAG: hypothetical protein Q8O74_03610 [bacterium]|nr:hypothetical protein [bacterium]